MSEDFMTQVSNDVAKTLKRNARLRKTAAGRAGLWFWPKFFWCVALSIKVGTMFLILRGIVFIFEFLGCFK